MDTSGLQELVLLSQRELLASQTLFDLWNQKSTTSSASWSAYVPPSPFTSQVLANIESTQNARFGTSSSTNSRHQPSSSEEEEDEIVIDEDEEEGEEIQHHHYSLSKKVVNEKKGTNSPSTADASLLLEMEKSDPYKSTSRNSHSRSSSPSPPSSPVSSSFAQQMTSLNLSNSPSSSTSSNFTFPQIQSDSSKEHKETNYDSSSFPKSFHADGTLSKKSSLLPFSSLPPLQGATVANSSPSSSGKVNGLYHSFWENSSIDGLRSFSSTNRDLNRTASHVPSTVDRQALPLRRSMSLEQQRQNPVSSTLAPNLPRKRPSSDSIVSSSAKIAHTVNTNSIPIHHSTPSISPSSSPLSTSPNSISHISSTSISLTHAHSASQKPRPKKKRRRRDEIERKFTCVVSDCAKCYGSEGALKTHVKLKHPEIYVEQFSWKAGPSLSSSPPSSPPSSSMMMSPIPPSIHSTVTTPRPNSSALQPPVLRAL